MTGSKINFMDWSRDEINKNIGNVGDLGEIYADYERIVPKKGEQFWEVSGYVSPSVEINVGGSSNTIFRYAGGRWYAVDKDWIDDSDSDKVQNNKEWCSLDNSNERKKVGDATGSAQKTVVQGFPVNAKLDSGVEYLVLSSYIYGSGVLEGISIPVYEGNQARSLISWRMHSNIPDGTDSWVKSVAINGYKNDILKELEGKPNEEYFTGDLANTCSNK